MKTMHLGIFILMLVLVATPIAGQGKRPLAPEDLVDLRTASDVNVSPDGKQVAFVVNEPADPSSKDPSRRESLWIVPTDASAPAHRLAPKLTGNSPRWSPEGNWLAFLSDKNGQTQVWRMPTKGGEAEPLTNAPEGVDSFKWSPDGRMIGYLAQDGATEKDLDRRKRGDDSIEVDHGGRFTRLWVQDVQERKGTLVTRQDIVVQGFDWSPDMASFAVAYVRVPGFWTDLDGHLAILRRRDGTFLKEIPGGIQPSLFGACPVNWSPDGKRILFSACAADKLVHWLTVADAQEGHSHPLLKDFPGTFSAASWDSDSRHIIGVALQGTRSRLMRINAASGETSTLTEVFCSDGDFARSDDGKTLAFLSEKVDEPGDIWSLKLGHQPVRLTHLNPQVAGLQLGTMREVTWISHVDGGALKGLLVLPPGYREGEARATVVEAHPGNTAWCFGWQGSWWQWGQFLASHGYIVFLPNPRGVTGLGGEREAMIRTYEGPAFQDTLDGLDDLISRKIVDPSRIGIGGWSNGGFMTLWAITHSNRFKAAVDLSGVADFPMLWSTGTSPLWEATFGDSPVRNRARFEGCSPIRYIDACQTPTLVLHGTDDPIVPYFQGKAIYRSLKALGVEAEMVGYPGDGHNLNQRAHQIDELRRTLDWFDRHLHLPLITSETAIPTH